MLIVGDIIILDLPNNIQYHPISIPHPPEIKDIKETKGGLPDKRCLSEHIEEVSKSFISYQEDGFDKDKEYGYNTT